MHHFNLNAKYLWLLHKVNNIHTGECASDPNQFFKLHKNLLLLMTSYFSRYYVNLWKQLANPKVLCTAMNF